MAAPEVRRVLSRSAASPEYCSNSEGYLDASSIFGRENLDSSHRPGLINFSALAALINFSSVL
jgi:hypothetical protein